MEAPCFYAVIPANVRYCTELEPNAKLLYGEITALTQKEGYCWASNKYFSDLYKVCERTVTNWLQSLEKEGFIEIQTCKNGMKWDRKIWIFQNIFTKGKNFPDRTEKNFPIEGKKISTDVIHKGILHKEQQQDARDSSPTQHNVYNQTGSLSPQTQGSVSVSKIAAVSSENKEKAALPPPKPKADPPKAPPPPKCYACLKEVPLDPNPGHDSYEKEWITKHYPEDTVKNALEWVRLNENKITTTLVQTLKWACEKGLKIENKANTKKSSVNYETNNRCFWRELHKIVWTHGFKHEFRDTGEYIEAGHSKIYYRDSSFLEQVANSLRKLNFPDMNIYKMIEEYRMSYR